MRLKSLEQLWEEGERRQIEVHNPEYGDGFTLLGLDGDRAIVRTRGEQRYRTRNATTESWELVEESPPPPTSGVPHWPVLFGSKNNFQRSISDELYPNLAAAKEDYVSAVRLMIEYPPVMLPVGPNPFQI